MGGGCSIAGLWEVGRGSARVDCGGESAEQRQIDEEELAQVVADHAHSGAAQTASCSRNDGHAGAVRSLRTALFVPRKRPGAGDYPLDVRDHTARGARVAAADKVK